MGYATNFDRGATIKMGDKNLGGTGKWEGITGEGKTPGILRPRMDGHWMLRSEMHWRINRAE
jgi:hypothetical protein